MATRPGAPTSGSLVPSAPQERLASIDVARSIAILLMLQGHFVSLTLAAPFRDLADPVYLIHTRLRGLTAPLFLTVAGLVFVYFVSGGDPQSGLANPRVRRGLRRGLLLLLLGYVLRFDFVALFETGQNPFARMAGTHVLHVVGVGLALLSLGWLCLLRAPRWVACCVLCGLGLAFFSATGWVRGLDLARVPAALSTYLVPVHGAEFSLFPWLGYVFVGGAIGVMLRYPDGRPKPGNLAWPFTLLGAALLLRGFATPWVFALRRACQQGPVCDGLPLVHNYLHMLAWVLALLALLGFAEPVLSRHTPPWLTRTGQHTLFLFVVHAALLYGAFSGLYLAPLVRQSLTPPLAAAGALAFVVLHVVLVGFWSQRGVRWQRADAPAHAHEARRR